VRYAPEVTEHFQRPRNTGPLPPGPGRVLAGHAASAAEGCEVEFHARIQGDRVAALHFAARACPHQVAASSLATELLAGAGPEATRAFDPLALEARLGLPAAKRGRLLVLAGALRNCLGPWDTTQLAATGPAASPT
jgi:NifU-like protein involved in Fe-S cluster formation